MCRCVCLALLMLMLHGCAVNPVTGEQDFVMLSQEEEIALGLQQHPKILKEYGEYRDPALSRYINQIGRRLARNSHRPQLKYHFTILDTAQVNAFALPGGYIYITRGLLAYLNSEAELAAVLGHEIGHVTARHGVRQYSAAMAGNVGFTLGSILVPELGSSIARDLFDVIGTALLRGYGREHELQADGLGAEYLARSGYDPNAMIKVIRVLKHQQQFASQRAREAGKEVQSYHGLFATHPDNDTRLKQVVGKATKLAKDGGTKQIGQEALIRRQDNLIFRRVNELDQSQVKQPLRLKVLTARPDTRFATLAKQTPIRHYAEEYLRLLNDYYPRGEPPVGRLIKTIE